MSDRGHGRPANSVSHRIPSSNLFLLITFGTPGETDSTRLIHGRASRGEQCRCLSQLMNHTQKKGQFRHLIKFVTDHGGLIKGSEWGKSLQMRILFNKRNSCGSFFMAATKIPQEYFKFFDHKLKLPAK